MNNCPKCGNPLQPGTSSCPICGTNISPVSTNTGIQKNNVTVASVGAPVQNNQSATQEINNQITAPEQPIATKPSNATLQPDESVMSQSNNVSVTPVVKESAPSTQVVQSVSKPMVQQPTIAKIEPTSTATPEQPSASALAPTVQVEPSAAPVPSIPASISVSTPQPVVTAPEPTKMSTKQEKATKKVSNKNVVLVVVVLLIAIIGGGAFMLFSGNSKKTKPTSNNNNQTLASSAVNTNGYKFNLVDGWLITEDGSNVIVTNNTDTVAIKLDHSSSNISEISEEMLKTFLNNNEDFNNTSANKMEISGKESYLVNANINNLPIQIYFIGGGSNLVLGVTVVYQTEESKNKYESEVTEMIGTLSYSDESIKAISTIDMYKDIFGIYNKALNSKNVENKPVEENPVEETPIENPEENQEENSENQENGEQQDPVQNPGLE